MQYDTWNASYPHYEHEAWHKRYKKPYIIKEEKIGGLTFKVLDDSPRRIYWEYTQPSYKDKPKLKRHTLSLDDYKWYGRCPKGWNKIFHIRPVRRKWKQFIMNALRAIEVDSWCDINWPSDIHLQIYDDADAEMAYCQCGPYEIVYTWEGLSIPSHKKHIYYY